LVSEIGVKKFIDMRFLNSFIYFGGFDIQAYQTADAMDAIVSLPFFCNLLGISISEVDFEKYNIRIKKEFNNKQWLESFSNSF
jgi:hypothetical protein